MDCKTIQDLLYDHVKNELDDISSRFIRDHLKSCPECRKELTYVKKYTKSMTTFNDIPLPKGFMDSVEDKIENSSLIKKIYKTLFHPLKIKLPLEAVGVLALSVIIFTLYKPHIPLEYSMEQPAPISESIVTDQRESQLEKTSVRDAASGTIKYRKTARKDDTDSPLETAREEVQLPEYEITADESAVDSIAQDKTVVKEKMVNIVLTVNTNHPPQATGSLRSAVKQERARKADSKFSRLKTEGQNKLSGSSAEHSEPSRAPGFQYNSGVIQNYAPENIKAIVASYKGKIIKEDINKRTGTTNYLIVEIPDTKYKAFINRLNNLGNIQQDRIPNVNKKSNRNIQFNIFMKNRK